MNRASNELLILILILILCEESKTEIFGHCIWTSRVFKLNRGERKRETGSLSYSFYGVMTSLVWRIREE